MITKFTFTGASARACSYRLYGIRQLVTGINEFSEQYVSCN